jgi:hypothetical protein
MEPSVARAVRRPLRSIAPALLGVAALAALIAGSASAASSPPASDPPANASGVEFWLDEAITPDARAGAALEIGVTLWDVRRQTFAEINDPEVTLHPAAGKAAAAKGTSRPDWPGHLIVSVDVPKGGPGRLDLGFGGRSCTSDGTCTDIVLPFALGGVGPPPDAPISDLVDATMDAPLPPFVAGKPIDLRVRLVPRAGWDPALLALPDRLVAFINRPRGTDLATAELRRPRIVGDPYTGQITPPEGETGDLVLNVAIPGENGNPDVVLPATVTRLAVVDGDDPAPPTPSARPAAGAPTGAPAAPTDLTPIVWVLGIAAVIGVGFGVSRALADL